MKKENNEQLIQELMDEGATRQEAFDMSSLAGKISKLSNIKLPEKAKREFYRDLEEQNSGLSKPKYSKLVYIPAMFMVLLIFILGANTVVQAQSSIPGNHLYPLKRLTERVISTVDKEFNNTIIKRRSEEIKILADQDTGDQLLENTINEYEKELNRINRVDSSQIKDSKRNLEQARDKVVSKRRERIDRLLLKIEERRKDDASGSAELDFEEENKIEKTNTGNKRE